MNLTLTPLKSLILSIACFILPVISNAQPDLIPDNDRLLRTLRGDLLENQDPCFINEGCVTGLGTRQVLRFETLVFNIGDEDFYVGVPPSSPSLENSTWEWDECHNHWHFESYAQYLLFNERGEEIPVGFKTGFCLIDSTCPTGIPKYNCRNQGISAGCGDLYDFDTDCQWVDITDIPDGTYTMVLRINWDRDPDVNGRFESDHTNNEARACFRLTRNAANRPVVDILGESACQCPDADRDGVCAIDDCDDNNPDMPNNIACPATDTGGDSPDPVNAGDDPFTTFPWLSGVVDPNDCAGETITVYQAGAFNFIYIESSTGSELYFQNGTLYCIDRAGFSCREIYRLTSDLIIATWTCSTSSDTPTPPTGGDTGSTTFGENPFDVFPWLSGIVDPTDCTDEQITVYEIGAFNFIHIRTAGTSVLYFETGELYCTDSPGFSCVSAYGLSTIVATWGCGAETDSATTDDSETTDPEPDSTTDDTTTTDESASDAEDTETPEEEFTAIEDNSVFITYPWLVDLFRPTTCIQVFSVGPHNYIHVIESNETDGTLYYQDGTLYCNDASNLNCKGVYGLTRGNMTHFWNCNDVFQGGDIAQNGFTGDLLGTIPAVSNQSNINKLPEFEIFPNPARDAAYLNLKDYTLAADAEINIYNYAGKTVFTEYPSGANHSIYIDLNAITNGFYIVELKSGNQRQIQKLIISK